MAPEVKEQHLNTLQLEEIDELQIGLKDFKVRTIALMDATAMLLHKKYQKQSKANQQSAEVVKELLNQEQNLIEKQYSDRKQQIYQTLQLNNQRNITVTTLNPSKIQNIRRCNIRRLPEFYRNSALHKEHHL